MDRIIDTGGPVYPHEFRFGDGEVHRENGMTLRDYFAAAALPTVLDDFSHVTDAARQAYRVADAMIAERECVRARS